jgi:hypothetical protein
VALAAAPRCRCKAKPPAGDLHHLECLEGEMSQGVPELAISPEQLAGIIRRDVLAYREANRIIQ